jgi:GH15 family glucan-1,4-alpha-glucosidase
MPPAETPEPPADAPIRDLLANSAALIERWQDPGGAYPASPTFSAYRGFGWLRDGSFVAEGMSRAGGGRGAASAGRFHDWVAGLLTARAGRIGEIVAELDAGRVPPRDQMLPARFAFDGSEGEADWGNFQSDGYGTWLWAVHAHAARHGADLGRQAAAIGLAADYAAAVWALPCYDWWEEEPDHRHVSTLGALCGGLAAAAASPVLDAARRQRSAAAAGAIRDLIAEQGVLTPGGLAKWLGAQVTDASVLACAVPFGAVDPGGEVAAAATDRVIRDLGAGGGVHRYPGDAVFGGGQWPVLAGLLGWNLAAQGRRAEARARLDWAASTAIAGCLLPEQSDAVLLTPAAEAGWIEQWGPSSVPLLWSHGMVMILADALGLANL